MANGHGSKISRLAFVDGLRALAILTVFITHGTEQLGPASTHGALLTRIAYDLNFGRVGVVIFFAVSGFLIPSSLRGEAGEGSLRFLLSRVFRLYPAFWLSVIPAVVTLHWMSGKPFSNEDILLNLTMLPRFFGAEYANEAYWTLEVETIFYGACLFLFLGRAIGSQFALSSLMFAGFALFYTSQGSIFGGALNPALSADAFYLSLNLACMFWGAMCRQWWEGRRMEPVPAVLFWTFTGYWLVYTPLHTVWDWYGLGDHEVDLRLAAGYGLGIGAFFLVLVTEASLGRVMAWIGRISYSMYLFHSPVLLLVTWVAYQYPMFARQPLELNLCYSIALSLLVADLCHRLVERPCIGLGRRLADILVMRLRRHPGARAEISRTRRIGWLRLRGSDVRN